MKTYPQTIFLKDYTAPSYWVDTVDLCVIIQADYTEVSAQIALRRNAQYSGKMPRSLLLQGEDLQLIALELNGQPLSEFGYTVNDEGLTLHDLPDSAHFRSTVRILPDQNTQLSGLYRSKDGYFTQCEAQGFRRITYYPDRPDVMAQFTCRIEADQARFPQLLSNGNPVESGVLPEGRHFATWEDPFKKPAYLFALVAARLDVLAETFVTASGREVRCAVYVEPGKLDQCAHAMAALKKSMRWDEAVFGLEMDLDHYMIVAVGDFNMGAMENKGLNIFNTKYVLARSDTATDTDFQNIDRVVAHEYFHNWTGNRVTCRDWFQLSLKEGLTVFRDQQFGMDTHSAAVTRIQDVRALRAAQFPEDAGPMAHPIRPVSYAEINNFYTATVYEKGAEVIRMIHTLLGQEKFRAGMDVYFARHDGQAVTCEDFVSAMQDASGIDLTQFQAWYRRAGTPTLRAEGCYDVSTQSYTLTLTQSLLPTAYEQRLQAAGLSIEGGALLMPLRLGLVMPDGSDAPICLAGEAASAAGYGAKQRVLSFIETTQTFVFTGLAAAPVPSLLRGFSAPVKLEFACADVDLAHLMAFDSDPVNRWEAGQQLAMRVLLSGVTAFKAGQGEALAWVPAIYVEAVRRLLLDEAADPALLAEALLLPSENVIAEAISGEVDPETIHAARYALRRQLANACRAEFIAARARAVLQNLAQCAADGAYQANAAQAGTRALANACLAYLIELGEADFIKQALAQLTHSTNMTDRMAALSLLANQAIPERQIALDAFYLEWKDEALVVDKWLQVQSTARLPGTVHRVRELMRTSD